MGDPHQAQLLSLSLQFLGDYICSTVHIHRRQGHGRTNRITYLALPAEGKPLQQLGVSKAVVKYRTLTSARMIQDVCTGAWTVSS